MASTLILYIVGYNSSHARSHPLICTKASASTCGRFICNLDLFKNAKLQLRMKHGLLAMVAAWWLLGGWAVNLFKQ